jgi:transcriptional regulator with XRE-family HTH domain
MYLPVMPKRTRPLDADREREIGAAVRSVREALKYSQREFAGLLGITRDQVANIEMGRTPLTYTLALALRDMFGTDLAALAGFSAGMRIEPDMWPSRDLAEYQGRSVPFSLVAREAPLNPVSNLQRAVERFPKGSLARTHFAAEIHQAGLDLLAGVPDGLVANAGLSALEAIKGTRARYPKLPPERAKAVLLELEGFIAHASAQAQEENQGLTDNSVLGRIVRVNPSAPPIGNMAQLLARVRESTSSRGGRAKLAKALGVSPSRVSEWLAGTSSPTGEATLRLLQWVAAQERQQTQGPSSAIAPPGPKTRSMKHHEKPQKSGPP